MLRWKAVGPDGCWAKRARRCKPCRVLVRSLLNSCFLDLDLHSDLVTMSDVLAGFVSEVPSLCPAPSASPWRK